MVTNLHCCCALLGHDVKRSVIGFGLLIPALVFPCLCEKGQFRSEQFRTREEGMLDGDIALELTELYAGIGGSAWIMERAMVLGKA